MTLTQQDREEIKAMIDSALRQGQFQVQRVPYHTHSGVDSPFVETGITKVSDNAFITSFGHAFAASSNANGAYGNDWFQMYCEYDRQMTAIPEEFDTLGTATAIAQGVTGANIGVMEMPTVINATATPGATGGLNGFLLKRTGGGAVIRAVSTASNGNGYIDLFEPIILRGRTSDPYTTASGYYAGMLYMRVGTGTGLRFYDGSAWRTVTGV